MMWLVAGMAGLTTCACSYLTDDSEATAVPEIGGGAMKLERAMFGAGCFWGVEAAFRKVQGVKETAVGYSGGHTANPSYEEVCSGTTGHTEVVQVLFDPGEISYEELLDIFWECHDPTEVNRQGPDVGWQYRSVIFYYTPEQKAAAQASKAQRDASGAYRRPVATAIEPAKAFYRAEDYHQQYLEKRGRSAWPM
jgi:peptide-methionine (S)-S-oxide reductase